MPEEITPPVALQLPFPELEKKDIAIRNDLRSDEFKHIIQTTGTYRIDITHIVERPGFNVRRVYNGLEELADSIDANDLETPLTVDVMKDGTVYVERGHRRLRALRILYERYLERDEVELFKERFGLIDCFVNPNTTTELERIKGLYSSNHFSPLSPVENSDIVQRLKLYYEYTHDQIAKELGMSRQSVDNYAKIAELPDNIKQALMDNAMSLNAALRVIRQVKDAEERAQVFEEMMSAKTTNVKNMNTGGNNERDMGGPLGENSDDDIEEEMKDFDTTSEEVEGMNECIQMLDKVTVMIARLNDTHPALVLDIDPLLGATRIRCEKTRDYLIKTQK